LQVFELTFAIQNYNEEFFTDTSNPRSHSTPASPVSPFFDRDNHFLPNVYFRINSKKFLAALVLLQIRFETVATRP